MTRAFLLLLVVVGMLGIPARAFAQPVRGVAPQAEVEALRKEPRFTFCKKPKRPLFLRQHELCTLAPDVDDCPGFAAACRDPSAFEERSKRDDSSSSSFGRALGDLAQVLVWVLVLAVVFAIAFPLIRAVLRSRRDRQLADAPPPTNVALAMDRKPSAEPERISDAEAALREADEHARRGDFARALSLYLAASLAALDRRGAIRLARHRTNGEYVRSCAEDSSRQSLRDIVREVDKVEFGNLAPTGEGVAHVAARASAVVRAPAGRSAPFAASLLLLVALLTACGARGPTTGPIADDPAGDELPSELLRHSGYTVSYLKTSIAALPMPTAMAHTPIVVVDLARVGLEEEAKAHLLRWVEEGGVLVLFGPPSLWPGELHVEEDHTTSARRVDVLTEEIDAPNALVATSRAMKWRGADPIAHIGTSLYAAHKTLGKGAVVGVAGEDLFTNIGASRSANAAALVGIVDVAGLDRETTGAMRGVMVPGATYEIHVARGPDGIPPPGNPFSALVQAGLGKGAWHALAAAVVLFLAFGIRHARARPAVPPVRRAFAEHVEATGAFYGRARALGHALASYGRFAEMRVRERVPRGGDAVAFLAARAKLPHGEVARVWKRATEANAADPPRGDELATIRDLRAMLVKALETG